jgi:hypothetical protein
VQIRFYDSDRAAIGQVTREMALEEPLARGDTSLLQLNAFTSLSEPSSAIAKATRRIQSAAFTGLKKWTYGQRWSEPLLPTPGQQSAADPGAGAGTGPLSAATPKLAVDVVNA